jgi:hypothetical protein
MADRIPNSYSMIPQNINTALLAQQTQTQGQPQQQVDAQATMGGLTNPEHGQIWRQMQQQYRTGENLSGAISNQVSRQVVVLSAIAMCFARSSAACPFLCLIYVPLSVNFFSIRSLSTVYFYSLSTRPYLFSLSEHCPDAVTACLVSGGGVSANLL